MNLYPTGYIAETIYNENGFSTAPNYVDIAVNDEGIVSVLEQKSGKVYQYDQEGNMLAAFGGTGNKQGKFVLPVSLAQNSAGEVFVLDQSTRLCACVHAHSVLQAGGSGGFAVCGR